MVYDVILTNSPLYQIGNLGEYYYPANLTNLIHTGSELASAAGLYHYTVTTNNVIEGTNQVSIGFHYVAVDASGNPIDTTGDGLPDYVKDSNGDGVYDAGDLANWLSPFNIYDEGKTFEGWVPQHLRLGYCRFNNTNSFPAYLTNEAGSAPPWGCPGYPVSDWSGNAVCPTNYYFIYPTVDTTISNPMGNGWTNADYTNGTFRFWWCPYSSTTSGLWLSILGTSNAYYTAESSTATGFYIENDGSDVTYLQTPPPGFVSNQWYQIVYTFTSTNMAMYVNGVLFAAPTFLDAPASLMNFMDDGLVYYPSLATDPSYDFMIGGPFTGEFDEIETFNYPLLAQAVAYGFPTFAGANWGGVTDVKQDTGYVGRSDLIRMLVDGVSSNNLASVTNVPECQLGYWRFNDASLIGEQGQIPLTNVGATLVPSWSGYAVNVGSRANSELVYPDVSPNGWANFNCRCGTIQFWFKPNWNSHPGSTGQFFYVGDSYESNEWTLTMSRSSSTVDFDIGSSGGTIAPLTATLSSLDSNHWVQITFTYSPTNTILYTNGFQASTGSGVTTWPAPGYRSNGIVIGNDLAGNAPINGQFDELKTFNYQLSSNVIWQNFATVQAFDANLDGIPDIIEDIDLPTPAPFLGSAVTVTGTIEAEQFDRGGFNTAYHNSQTNPVSGYRASGMFITNCDDTGLGTVPMGYCLDQTHAGDWTSYTINVSVPQTYVVEARVAGGTGSGGMFQISFTNVNNPAVVTNTGPLTIPSTYWTNVSAVVYLTNGAYRMTLNCLTNGSTGYVGKFNYFTVYPWWQAGFTAGVTTNVPASALVSNVASWSAASNNTSQINLYYGAISSTGGTLSFPPGTYYVAQTNPNETNGAVLNAVLNITNSNIQILGSNTTLIGYNRATTFFYIGEDAMSTHYQCSNITFANLSLVAQPHLAVTNLTNVVWTYPELIQQSELELGDTGDLVGMIAPDSNHLLCNILVSNCQFTNANEAINVTDGVSNCLICNSTFVTWSGTNGYTTNGLGTNIYGGVGIFAGDEGQPYGGVYNLGVVGCTYNGNPNLATASDTNNLFCANNGFVFLQQGGNWFVLRNKVTNSALENIQLQAGPATIAGNNLSTLANDPAACAFVVFACTNGAYRSFISNSFTIVGNSVSGNIFGQCVDVLELVSNNWVITPYSLNFSGNYIQLTSPETSCGGSYGSVGAGVMLYNCQPANIAGNTFASAMHGVAFDGASSNSIILMNDFSGCARSSIVDVGNLFTNFVATNQVNNAIVIGNNLAGSQGFHLKIPCVEANSWLLYNNQYLDGMSNSVNASLDPQSAPVHIIY
jgi:hypothetical protein